MRVLTLSASDVEGLLDWKAAIDSQRLAFAQLASGHAISPFKLTLPGSEFSTWALCYAARLDANSDIVVKIVSVADRNPAIGLPRVIGTVLVFDGMNGQLKAILDGTAITTRRTAAASALAVSLVALPDASELAIYGSGVQALAHGLALTHVRPIQRIRLWSPNAQHRRQTAAALESQLGVPCVPADSPRDVARGAHIVALCTHSESPVFLADWTEPGMTIVTIGSYTPDRCEVDERIVSLSNYVIVDDRGHALHYAGPIIRALQHKWITEDALIQLGDIILGTASVSQRKSSDIAFVNLVGVGIQDAAAAHTALSRALERNIGTLIEV